MLHRLVAELLHQDAPVYDMEVGSAVWVASRTISSWQFRPKFVARNTFRWSRFARTATAVRTPVWFGEKDDKLYVMTRSDSGKYKRIRNNPQVRVAPCTVRGKITGPEFAAIAQLLPAEDWPRARKTINSKYWLARIPFFWSKKNVYLEIEVTT